MWNKRTCCTKVADTYWSLRGIAQAYRLIFAYGFSLINVNTCIHAADDLGTPDRAQSNLYLPMFLGKPSKRLRNIKVWHACLATNGRDEACHRYVVFGMLDTSRWVPTDRVMSRKSNTYEWQIDCIALFHNAKTTFNEYFQLLEDSRCFSLLQLVICDRILDWKRYWI